MNHENAIELRNITKRFGKVVANDGISLTIRTGEILAILGENGSGKTTLMNMISGIYYPDEGQILVHGEEVSIRSPRDAFPLGIGMIHQHFKLVDVLTAAENIVLGLPGEKRLDIAKVATKINKLTDKYGFELDPFKKIYEMSVSEKQTVEIVKMLYRGAKILILDEPTAVLTPQETDRLFAVLRNMRQDGNAIVIITHKLNEVLELSDRVSVLRKGKYAGTVETKDATVMSLTEMMVGKRVELNIQRDEPVNLTERLKVRDVTCVNPDGVITLNHASFDLQGGEILGIAGVAGSGQREILEAIAGLTPVESGEIDYFPPDHEAQELTKLSAVEINRLGVKLSFVPEDRLGMGLVGPMDMVDNMMIRSYKKGGLLLGGSPLAQDAGRAHHQRAGGRHAGRDHAGGQALRRQRAEGAGGPRDRLESHRADGGLSGARSGHQFVVYDLQSAQRAEAPRRGGAVRGRGSGRAAGAVRPDHGHVRRPGHGRGGRAHDHQGRGRHADDAGRKGALTP